MANHKSSKKRARQNVKRRLRNRALKSSYKTEIKKLTALLAEKKTEEAKNLLPSVYKVIDQANTKGVLPKNTASRNKSNITRMLNKALAEAQA